MKWIKLSERAPQAKNGKVLIWHDYQGVMVISAEKLPAGRFVRYWMPLPEEGYTPISERRPDKTDADRYGCVIGINKLNGAEMTVLERTENTDLFTAWMRAPEGPKKGQEDA